MVVSDKNLWNSRGEIAVSFRKSTTKKHAEEVSVASMTRAVQVVKSPAFPIAQGYGTQTKWHGDKMPLAQQNN